MATQLLTAMPSAISVACQLIVGHQTFRPRPMQPILIAPGGSFQQLQASSLQWFSGLSCSSFSLVMELLGRRNRLPSTTHIRGRHVQRRGPFMTVRKLKRPRRAVLSLPLAPSSKGLPDRSTEYPHAHMSFA